MNTQQVSSLLKKLQTELESGKPIDDSLRDSLKQLDRDIQQVLSKPAQQAETDTSSIESRAQALEARFETEHPYLATMVRDVMDALGKMGI
ncbi:DUF4404 family protein [Aquabacterium sp.]|uniref:DUF4404 family protein n=1 Tax=Aquabacterium sp. TaxID=1872578 RepID=UPI003B6D702E